MEKPKMKASTWEIKRRLCDGPLASRSLSEEIPPTKMRKDGTMGRMHGVKNEKRPARKAKSPVNSPWDTETV